VCGILEGGRAGVDGEGKEGVVRKREEEIEKCMI